MTDPTPMATGRITVTAPTATVYDAVTSLDVLAQLADEAVSMRWIEGSRARVGATFAGHNRNGIRRWTTTCTVVDAAPGERFGFEVTYGPLNTPIAHWRYDIAETETGCTVTESMWDRRPAWFRRIAGVATGVSDRERVNAEHIDATLRRLKAHAER